MQPVTTTNKPLSVDGQSVSSERGTLFNPLKAKSLKRAWIAHHEMWIGVLKDGQRRAVTPVVIGNGLHWCDCITGGISWPIGTEFLRNAQEAEEILLTTHSEDRNQYKEANCEEG